MPNVSPLRYPFDTVIISQFYQFRPKTKRRKSKGRDAQTSQPFKH